MADLSNIGLDHNVKPSAGEFEVVPPGKYTAAIINDEIKPTKNGSGQMLILTVQITEKGEYLGTELIDRLNIINQNPKAQIISQSRLRHICDLCGSPFPPPDTRRLHGKPIQITVKVEEFESNNNPGQMLQSNRISRYDRIAKAAHAQQPSQNNGW